MGPPAKICPASAGVTQRVTPSSRLTDIARMSSPPRRCHFQVRCRPPGPTPRPRRDRRTTGCGSRPGEIMPEERGQVVGSRDSTARRGGAEPMGSGADPQKIAAVAAYLPRGFPAATVDVIDANRPDELGKYYRVIQGGNMVCR